MQNDDLQPEWGARFVHKQQTVMLVTGKEIAWATAMNSTRTIIDLYPDARGYIERLAFAENKRAELATFNAGTKRIFLRANLLATEDQLQRGIPELLDALVTKQGLRNPIDTTSGHRETIDLLFGKHFTVT